MTKFNLEAHHWDQWRPDWSGETAVCIGSGPSLAQGQVDHVQGKARTVVVNSTYQLAPWADILNGYDLRWWLWNNGAPEFQGLKVSLNRRAPENFADIKWLKCPKRSGYDPRPGFIRSGKNAGYQAVHIAADLGAKRIILLGFDMKPSDSGRMHWHADHRVPTQHDVFRTALDDEERTTLDHFELLSQELPKYDVEVINATPGSALECFPKASLYDVL